MASSDEPWAGAVTYVEERTKPTAQLSPIAQRRLLEFAREQAHPLACSHTSLPPGTPGNVVVLLRIGQQVGETQAQA
jgi:hypothetical protein